MYIYKSALFGTYLIRNNYHKRASTSRLNDHVILIPIAIGRYLVEIEVETALD